MPDAVGASATLQSGRPKPASVLILGSGPVVIGQAAEFDYAGTALEDRTSYSEARG